MPHSVYLEMGFDMYVPSQSDGNATDAMVRYHNSAENLERDTDWQRNLLGWKCETDELQAKGGDAEKAQLLLK